MSNPVTGYDLTIPAEGAEGFDKNQTIEWLNGWAKKWVFQTERGEIAGKLHQQVRLHLTVRRRIGELISVTKDTLPVGHHWSITSNTVHQGQQFNYVMKADTRVEGPFNDKDFEVPPPLTRQLRTFMGHDMWPWQTQVLQLVQQSDDRSIKIIYDEFGNAGKSIFCEFLEYQGLAYEVPSFRESEDIMQCVMSQKPKKAYIIDMPRGMKKDKLASFYSGLEMLKNGVAYDKRYSFKKMRFDRPQIIVFTNSWPDWSLMSRDRWELFRMGEGTRRLTSPANFASRMPNENIAPQES